ncbi:hypothetical protein WA026_013610 [Henosepilachna vigintioctopunctata]|uniref:Uncharacterized protein n=1 Tax=Henosepilachna vigintioctopunctata TaxID=420089 RepID=A0AAW1VF92_9CUCU
MGHTGSKITKFRKSFRRMSLSKSRDNLKTEDSKKIRHSRSLTNLTSRKKDVIKLSDEKKLRRNTVVISSNIPSINDIQIEVTQLNGDSAIADETKTDSENIDEKSEIEIKKIEGPVLEEAIVLDCSGVLALKAMDSRLEEMENQIEIMSHEDLFIYHSTFKDEIHNFWIKAYGIKEATERVKPKKIETIDYVKKLLHILNNKMFQRNNSDSYC